MDTSVLVAGLRRGGGVSRRVLRLVIDRDIGLVFGTTLWLEYESVLQRGELDWTTTAEERVDVVRTLAAAGRWVRPYYSWRPNLRDEADNHVIELAVAAGVEVIVSWNVRDLRGGELIWPALRCLTPPEFLREIAS